METVIDEDWTSIYKGENKIKNSIYENKIKNSIVQDDEDGFVTLLEKSLVINSRGMVKLKFGESEVCPYELLTFICHHRAINCGTALFKGKTDLKLDLNIPINQGAFPLHEAASSLSLCLTELFLHHGAWADVQCDANDSEHNGLLPLHMALGQVRYDGHLAWWTPRKSIFKLIIILCLPKMKEALETNRLLANNTEEIKEVIRYFAKDGKLIELAVLLMVAREKVMDSITFESVEHFSSTGCLTLHQCVQLELAALINSEYRLMYKKEDKKLSWICKNLKVAMISMLQLLEIFERAGDAIEAYLQLERTNVPEEQVAEEVARLLAVAGFKLKSRDTDLSNIVNCCPTKPVLKHSSDPVKEGKGQSEVPVQCGSNQRNVHAVRPNKRPTHSLPNNTWRLIHSRLSPSALSSSILPLHVSWNRKAHFCSGFPKTMGSQVKERLKGEGQYVRRFSPVKQFAYFVLVVKRGIRFI